MLSLDIPQVENEWCMRFSFDNKEIGRVEGTSQGPQRLSFNVELFQEREREQVRPWYCEEISVSIYDNSDLNSVTGALKSTYSMMKTKAAGAGTLNIGSQVANFKIPLKDATSGAHGGKWYKVVNSNASIEHTQDKFKEKYVFILMSLSIHSADEDQASSRDSNVSMDAMNNLEMPSAQLTLSEILPPSSPYFRHLYVDFSSAEEDVAASQPGPPHVYSGLFSVPLPGPTEGEEVLDLRENVQWRCEAGMNGYGDLSYVLCKGIIVITDLRIIFLPLCITSSLWWQSGAISVPTRVIGGSLSAGAATDEPVPPAGVLRTVRRYTYVLPLSAILDCKAMPTPSHSSATIAMAMEGRSDVSDALGASNPLPPPPPCTDATSRDRALAAFLKRADSEYDAYCREQRNADQDSSPRDSHMRALEALSLSSGSSSTDKLSHNLVIVAKDGATAEFTVPSLVPEGCVLTLPPRPGHINLESSSEVSSRFYGSGLCSQLVTPEVWATRVREMVLWKACEDLCNVLWSQYMRQSVQMHLKRLETIAFTEDFDEDGEDGEDEDDDDGSDSGGSVSEEAVYGAHGQGQDFLVRYERTARRLKSCTDGVEVEHDYQRMKVGNAGWRVSDLNDTYELCDTYPQALCFPESLSDEDVRLAALQRSKARLPVLVWIHPVNKAALTRSSQPMTGVSGKSERSEHDIKLCLEIKDLALVEVEPAPIFMEGGMKIKMTNKPALRIADARPRLNANANALQGKGFENIGNFGGGNNATLLFMDIENIHVMRNSINRLKQGLAHNPWGWSEAVNIGGEASGGTSSREVHAHKDTKMDTEIMSQSSWKVHLSYLIKGAVAMAESLLHGHPVLVHCSDGWDRTSQLSSLTQILLDPFYRTIDGFLLLIEKEWCAFGHRIESRLRIKPKRAHSSRSPKTEEVSPVFLQFLDCVWQIHRQHTRSFAFSQHFLVVVAQVAQCGFFFDFRENCERERRSFLRYCADKCNLRREEMMYGTFVAYIKLLCYCPAHKAVLSNPLYQAPRPRDRDLQYIRPRCTGPHDLEMWRAGLCGFSEPSLGVQHDPSDDLNSLEEEYFTMLAKENAHARQAMPNESLRAFMQREVVEVVVEEALDTVFHQELVKLRMKGEEGRRGEGLGNLTAASEGGDSESIDQGNRHVQCSNPPSSEVRQVAQYHEPVRKGTPIQPKQLSTSRKKGTKAKAKAVFSTIKKMF